jgi:hypothetical protein
MDALCGVHGVNNRFGKENDYQKRKYCCLYQYTAYIKDTGKLRNV